MQSKQTKTLLLLGGAAAAAVVWAIASRAPSMEEHEVAATEKTDIPSDRRAKPASEVDAPHKAPGPTATAGPVNNADEISAFARAWDSLDLVEVRKAMPENLVWKLAAPTDDPAVLEARKKSRQYWEALYGRVYSNTASVEEIHEYYAHQQQRSSDYIEFVSHIVDNHERDLRIQDLKLLHLARSMHAARLQEIPRRQADALARQEAHAKAREAWLAEKKAASSEGSADSEASTPSD